MPKKKPQTAAKSPAKSPAKKPAKTTPMSAQQRQVLKTIHRELQPKAVEMREDELGEISGQLEHRHKWGAYIEEFMDEKRYGDSQIERLAEFLGKRPDTLWEVRRFYRTYPAKKHIESLLKMRRQDGKPLSWSVLREVLRADFESQERQQWLEHACRSNMDARDMRKAVLEAKGKATKAGKKSRTPAQAMNSWSKRANQYHEGSEGLTDVLTERLINGNADDFTDDVMAQLAATRQALLDMREELDQHLALVEECEERGRLLRSGGAESAETEAEVPAQAAASSAAASRNGSARSSNSSHRAKNSRAAQSSRTAEATPDSAEELEDSESTPILAGQRRRLAKKKGGQRPTTGDVTRKISSAKARATSTARRAG